MRGLLWCGLFCCCLLAAGCADYMAKTAALHAAEDDAKCQSYGAKQGDPAYVQCRAQLDAVATIDLDVRFTPKSRHSSEQSGCPLCANSGHYTDR
jgi:hypothetical protein